MSVERLSSEVVHSDWLEAITRLGQKIGGDVREDEHVEACVVVILTSGGTYAGSAVFTDEGESAPLVRAAEALNRTAASIREDLS